MKKRRTIYVSIASYCDPLLWWTVQSAWEAAIDRSSIFFGVVDQSPLRANELVLSGWSKHLRYVHIGSKDSRGACWARSVAFGLHFDEEYLLQIDSHTFFEFGWDERLVSVLEKIASETRNPKIVLSTRPFAFDISRSNMVRTARYTDDSIILRPKLNSAFTMEDPTIHFDGMASGAQSPVLGCQIAAGFIFTRSSFIDEIPYDPHLYFHGEEQNLSIRAFTRGWDIWHPESPPVYHKYKDHSTETNIMHWDEGHERERVVRWTELQKRARQRMKSLLYQNSDLGAYGLGSERTMDDFYRISGIDYKNLTIDQRRDFAT